MSDFQRCDACPVKDLPTCPAEHHARYCALAAKGGVWPDKIRSKAGIATTTHEPALPSIGQMAMNYARAQIKHTFDGRRKATEEIFLERISICENCVGPEGKFRASDRRCSARTCGCTVDEKAKWASESCPLGKWKAIPRD